jgi:Cu-Zn family superoxide dismutase
MLLINQLFYLLNQPPAACAHIIGSSSYPRLSGLINFYMVNSGILVVAEVSGLPIPSQLCGPSVFAFHIHAGSDCSGTKEDPFANAGAHYNPNHCDHPEHAGDLPPLFANEGYAFMAVYTTRFSVQEIIGRTILIHASPDDFTTQPSGNSGEKIACGQIERTGIIRP